MAVSSCVPEREIGVTCLATNHFLAVLIYEAASRKFFNVVWGEL